MEKVTKQLLIDSILRDYPIPEVFFKESDIEGIEFEVTDGQQRVLTILQFMNDEFRIKNGTVIDNINLGGLYYSQLLDDFKNQFDSYGLNYVAIQGTDDEIEEMFRRFQAGVNIKNVETRNSISGKVRDVKQNLLQNPFFTKVCGVNSKTNTRMQYDELIEQILLLETTGITDVRNPDINKMYDEYNKIGIPEGVISKIESVLDYMYEGFKEFEVSSILKKVALQSIYLVLSDFISQDPEQKYKEEFVDFFYNFENERKQQKDMPENEENAVYKKYDLYARGGSASKESLQGRKELLMQEWLKWISEIKVDKV
jgi:hypothetical protein